MVFAGIPTDQLLHTRAAQDLLDRGRQEGQQEGEARGRVAEAAAGSAGGSGRGAARFQRPCRPGGLDGRAQGLRPEHRWGCRS